jgi:hypothetical protein
MKILVLILVLIFLIILVCTLFAFGFLLYEAIFFNEIHRKEMRGSWEILEEFFKGNDKKEE